MDRTAIVLVAMVVSTWLAFALQADAEPVASGVASLQLQVSPDSGPVIVPEPSDEAMQYYHSGIALWLVGVVWGLAVPAALLFGGASARLRSTAARMVGNRWYPTIALYLVFLSVVLFVLDLPLSYYGGFVRQHAYELSNQTFGKWLADLVKGFGVSVVGTVAFVWVPYWLIRKSPRRWWLYTGLSTVPFLLFVQLVTPIWIAPLFNDFGPMHDPQLEAEILALADRAGIEGGRVFEVDKSVDTKAVNAYVTGFLGTKRIVLWDTIIAKLDRDELLFVMGHEMGHYVLGHVVKIVCLLSLLVLGVLYGIHRVAGGLIARYSDRFGFDELSDVASYPLLILLFGGAFFFIGPVASAGSRYVEHEADRFGLELVQDGHAAATAFVKLQQENLANPRPYWLDVIMRSSHPPLGSRIDFMNTYRPWETGEPLVYGDRFENTGGR